MPRWKVALAIGVPATVGLVGLWFYRLVLNEVGGGGVGCEGGRLGVGQEGSSWKVALAIGVPATVGLVQALVLQVC